MELKIVAAVVAGAVGAVVLQQLLNPPAKVCSKCTRISVTKANPKSLMGLESRTTNHIGARHAQEETRAKEREEEGQERQRQKKQRKSRQLERQTRKRKRKDHQLDQNGEKGGTLPLVDMEKREKKGKKSKNKKHRRERKRKK